MLCSGFCDLQHLHCRRCSGQPGWFSSDAGAPFVYRLDGSLFNIRRFTAETKLSHDRVFELQYADDVALLAHSLPPPLRVASTCCQRLTYMLDSLSKLRRQKSCPLLHITILPHLLLLSMATCLSRHASLRIWRAY